MHVTIARRLQNCLDLLLKHCSPFLDKCSLKLGYDPACSGVFNRKPTETKCWPSNHLDKLLIVGHCAGETGIVFGVHAGAPHHIASVQSDIHRSLSDQTWCAHGCPRQHQQLKHARQHPGWRTVALMPMLHSHCFLCSDTTGLRVQSSAFLFDNQIMNLTTD